MNLMLLSITGLSVGVSLAAALLAWQVVRDGRRRSAHRVAALAAEIAGEPEPLPGAADGHEGALFGSVQGANSRTMTVATAGAGAVVVVLIGAVAILVGSSSPSGTLGESAMGGVASTRSIEETESAPLELVTLDHDRRAGGLRVRGVVRNAAGTPARRNLAAVVLAFRADGGFLASGRAALSPESMPPGGEAAFEVDVPEARNVERYRVSFRTDTAVIPHVDRRETEALSEPHRGPNR